MCLKLVHHDEFISSPQQCPTALVPATSRQGVAQMLPDVDITIDDYDKKPAALAIRRPSLSSSNALDAGTSNSIAVPAAHIMPPASIVLHEPLDFNPSKSSATKRTSNGPTNKQSRVERTKSTEGKSFSSTSISVNVYIAANYFLTSMLS
jgi:hypothetical protein